MGPVVVWTSTTPRRRRLQRRSRRKLAATSTTATWRSMAPPGQPDASPSCSRGGSGPGTRKCQPLRWTGGEVMSLDRERAAAFVDGYGQTWESWDIAGFVELFNDEVVYVAHPTEETVVGREALRRYVRREASEQG